MDKEERFQLISDEIKVLYSIFSGEGEFLFNGSPPDANVDLSCHHLVEGKIRNVQLSVQISCAGNMKLTLNLTLSKHYPNSLSEISVSCVELTRKKLSEIQMKLVDYSSWSLTEFRGEPVILKLVNWLQDNVLQTQLDTPGETKTEPEKEIQFKKDENVFIAVLRFDHMRSRKKYLKKISNWMKEYNLNGLILFFAKEIIAVVEGLRVDINKYLKCLRTCTVDVDSAGRPCKERMMDLVCELFEKTEQHNISDGFKIIECTSLQEFVKIFESTGLTDVYKNYIKCSKY